MKREEIIQCIVEVCATIVVNANRSESLYLEQLLGEKNRSLFVSTAIQIALRIGTQKPEAKRALQLHLKMTPQELSDVLNPKQNFITESKFEELVRGEIARLRQSI